MLDDKLLSGTLLPLLADEATKVSKLSAWMTPDRSPSPYVKPTAKPEHRLLADLSRTPWLALVVEAVVQALSVSGYRSTASEGVWGTWLANRMPTRQYSLHREALAYGHAYMTVLPGFLPNGDKRAVFRGWSPGDLVVVYDDPVADDFPQFALARTSNKDQYVLLDASHKTKVELKNGRLYALEEVEHNVGVCPVVRYVDTMDLRGNIKGQIEPNIPLAERIYKTTYDRMLAQHFTSWKVKTATGLDIPEEQEDQQQMQINLAHNDILIGEDPDVRFGSLPETPLDPFINAENDDIATLAAVTQTPLFALTGTVANLSADAIAAARAPFTQKVTARQESFGQAHAQALRLAAHIQGDGVAANDFNGFVTWENREVASLSQIADAVTKLNPVGVPAQALFAMLPGVTEYEASDWASNMPNPESLAN